MINYEFLKENWQVIVGAFSLIAYMIAQRELLSKVLKKICSTIVDYIKIPYTLKDYISSFTNKHEEIMQKLDKLTYETSANGGKSLKDFVINIFDNVLKNRDMVYLVLDQKPIAVFEANNVGDIVWTNTAMSVLLGLDKQDILHKGWLVAIEDHEREEVYKDWTNSIISGTPYSSTINIVNQETNSVITCRIKAHQIKSGTSIWYYGNIIPLN